MRASTASARGPRQGTGPPADPVKARLLRLHLALLGHFGPQRWWPGRTPYEIAAGAILTQHTAWTNAARALAILRARRLLTAARVAALPQPALAALIRPAGTYRLKARRLQGFTRWLLGRFGARWSALRRAALGPLRRELLAVPGLGPETADAILLYAAARPVFVADAYVRRVLVRHRLLGPGAGYEDARAFVEAHLPSDPALFNEFHALLVAAGKAHCGPAPRCQGCPLAFDLGGRRPAATARGPRAPARRPGARGLSGRRAAGGPAARRRRGSPASAPARPSP